MQIINSLMSVLMSLGLVAFGLMLVFIGLQFGAIILFGTAAAIACAIGWVKKKITGK